MAEQTTGRHARATGYRIPPGPLVGCAVVLLYMVVTFGLQLASGLPYAEWTRTANNGLRAGVLPLGIGSVLLVAFLVYARWDMVWRDPARLPLTAAMKVAMAFFALAVVVRLAGIAWSSVTVGLLLVVLAIGVLVGFAEETLFRGIFLRAMRTGGRSEGSAALWTSIGFGLFHLPNALVGVGAAQLAQVGVAAVTGASLYVFRRSRGTIVVAMVAHGVWDVSTFLVASHAATWAALTSAALVPIGLVAGIVALVSIWRVDRHRVVTPEGVQEQAAA